MNKDSIKIKYLIGSFRDNPDYPTFEDFEYLIKNWYFHEGGHHFIHVYRGIPESNGPIFPDSVLIEKLGGDKETAKELIQNLISNNRIKPAKTTKFTDYFEII
jgi:hypothetical protein